MTRLARQGAIVISGAGSGIGQACAQRFSGEPRILVDRDASSIASGVSDRIIEGDIAEQSTIQSVIDAIVEHGGLAASIHAAGVGSSRATAAEIIRTNLFGTYRLERALRDVAGAGAVLVMLASIAGYGGVRKDKDRTIDRLLSSNELEDAAALTPFDAYCLSKYAVQRLAVRNAALWGQIGARILSLSPGPIDTPMLPTPAERSADFRQMIGDAALRRIGTVDEVADVATFLCSGGASFCTGCDICVDGGLTAASNVAGQMSTQTIADR